MESDKPMSRQVMRSLTTYEIDADGLAVARSIPRPDIPLHPVLSCATFFGSGDGEIPAIVDVGQAAFVTAGRIAIARALDLIGVKPGDTVLLPAYHCPAMVEALVWMSARPAFYRLREDLSADLEDAAAKMDAGTRALMIAHYFGFPQDLHATRSFCDAHGLALIEDCAHSFFGTCAGRPIGSVGDYAIGSLTKFFPVREGGCLVSARNDFGELDARLRRQGALSSLFTMLDTVEDAMDFGRLWGLRPAVRAVGLAKRALKPAFRSAIEAKPVNPAQRRAGTPGQFDDAWVDVRISAASLAVARLASRRRIAVRRRKHYATLATAFSRTRGCRPLLPDLPDGVVPYMFPLWIDDLDRLFRHLEDRAVPMHRFGQFPWPGVDESVCRVSHDLSRRSIQLPCHQELTDGEVQEMIDRVHAVVAP
jgi:perosamine synthetase